MAGIRRSCCLNERRTKASVGGVERISTVMNRGARVGQLIVEHQPQKASEEPLPLRLILPYLK